MATMIVLFLLAHASDDGDAMMLLVLAVPAFVICFYAVWINLSREYQPGPDNNWEAIEEEDE